jgi:hypothetical protein
MTINLTKNEAVLALSNGSIVTHRMFYPNEWVRQVGGIYEFEDGIGIPSYEFWDLKNGDVYLDGWYLLEFNDGASYSFTVNEKKYKGIYNKEKKSFIIFDKFRDDDSMHHFPLKYALNVSIL